MSSETLMFSRESLKSLQRCQRNLFKSSLENISLHMNSPTLITTNISNMQFRICELKVIV